VADSYILSRNSVLPRLLQHDDEAILTKVIRVVTPLSKARHLSEEVCPLVSRLLPNGDAHVFEAALSLVERQGPRCSRAILSVENIKAMRLSLETAGEFEAGILRELLHSKRHLVADPAREHQDKPTTLLLG
jgi:hypothetical protein